jgi:hypothetical protein
MRNDFHPNLIFRKIIVRRYIDFFKTIGSCLQTVKYKDNFIWKIPFADAV